MTYWKNTNAPVEAFNKALETYEKMILKAIEHGYTRDQAIGLLQVWAMLSIAGSVDDIGEGL